MAKEKKQKVERVLETDKTVDLPIETLTEPVEDVELEKVEVADDTTDAVDLEVKELVEEPALEPIETELLVEVVNEPAKPKGDQFTTFGGKDVTVKTKSVIPSVEPKLYDRKTDGQYEVVKFIKDLDEVKIITDRISGVRGETKKITSEQAAILRRAKVIL